MISDQKSLPTSAEALRTLVQSQHAELLSQQTKLDQQKQFIEQLLEQIRLSRHQHFGGRSERYSPDQLALMFNEAEATQEADDCGDTSEADTPDEIATPRRARRGRRRLPPELPRVDVIHDLETESCHCDQCQSTLVPFAQKISEQLDIIPAQLRVLRHIRQSYRCTHCEGQIKTAALPPQPIPKSLASPGTLAHIAISKYVDGLPLYRQEAQLKRIKIDLPRSTQATWMVKSGQFVQPLINLLGDTQLGYDIISMDETRSQVLKKDGKTPQSQSYMWVQRGGPPDTPIILFDYDPSRSQDVPIRLLAGFTGYLQTDGYEGYAKACGDKSITSVGCWAHVRRKFDEALKSQGNVNPEKRKASLAAVALNKIQALYRIEREAKLLTPEQRHQLRQSKAVPMLDEMRIWLDTQLPLVPPKSGLGKAMNYVHRQWDKLTVYTQDGRLRIDNNLTENAIRPFVIGRKNFLFSATVEGANASANLYSLIETAKANGLEPYEYLKKVFTELPKATSLEDIEALLPLRQLAGEPTV